MIDTIELIFIFMPTIQFGLVGGLCLWVRSYKITGIISLVCAITAGLLMYSAFQTSGELTGFYMIGIFIISLLFGWPIIGIFALVEMLNKRKKNSQQ